MSFTVDTTEATALAVCHDCGRRQLVATRLAAWRWAAEHERREHPGQLQASKRYHDAQRRAVT